MTENLGIHQKSEIPENRILCCGNGPHYELLTFNTPDQNKTMPKFSDYNGHHEGFYVDNMDAAVAYLKSKGVKVLGSIKDGVGPEAGEGSTYVHFLAPWSAMFELVSYPNGKLYEQKQKRLWVPDEVSQ